MLKALVSNIGKSIDALTAAGKTADIKAMIWHQGESDRSGTGPDNYHDNLKAVVKYVRDYLVEKTGDSKYATLDFICGTVPTNSSQYNKKVYDALFTLASEDEHFHVIETSPGTFIGDQLHFDTNCAERLGINMYNKMVDLGLVNGEKQAVPDPTVPEQTTITLDFQTWTNENLADASTYASLIAEEGFEVTKAWRAVPQPLEIGGITLDYTSLMNETMDNWIASNALPAGITTGWYIPSLGDWQNIERQQTLIDTQLSAAGGTPLPTAQSWSCNVRAAGSNWCYVLGKTALSDRYKGVACNSSVNYRFLFAF